MKRKVMKIADTTYVVSIPLKIIREKGIKKGDELDVCETEEGISIRLENKEQELKKACVNIMDFWETGGRYIVTYYRLGYDEFEIKYNNPDFINEVPRELSENTIGLAIIEQGENSFVIKDLSGKKIQELPNISKRVWFLIKNIADEISKALENNSFTGLKNIYAQEKTVNQFVNYCLRLISSMDKSQKSHSLYFFIRTLEDISDLFRDIGMNLYNTGKIRNKDLPGAYFKVNELFKDFYACYYNYSLERLEKIINDANRLIAEIEEKSKQKSEIVNYILLHSICRKIKHLCSPIIELNL